MKLPITKQELKQLKEENKRGVIFSIDYAITGAKHLINYTYTNNFVLNSLTDTRWLKRNAILYLINKDEILNFIKTKKQEFPKANHRLINSIES